MAYRIKSKEAVDVAVRRVAREQVDRALADLEDDGLDVHETIHEVRKRCKKVRGLLRLVRPALGDTYQQENAWFRDAGRMLSELRDAASFLECWNALMKRYQEDVDQEAFRFIGDALLESREELFQEKDVDQQLTVFRDRMKTAGERVGNWRLDADEFEAVGKGMAKTYKRARKAMRAAHENPGVESFHEWRKRVKYHRYHNRLLREIWRPVLSEHRNEVKHLSDLLGDEHDLAVLRAALVSDDRFGEEALRGAAIGLVDNRRKELQAWAMPLGNRIFADRTKVWLSRMGSFWKAWRAEEALGGALGKRSRAVYS